MDNFDAKFGPAPAIIAAEPSIIVVALGQIAVCAALLYLVQPPFVTRDEGAGACPMRIIVIALLTTALAWGLHTCRVQPLETLRTACGVVLSK